MKCKSCEDIPIGYKILGWFNLLCVVILSLLTAKIVGLKLSFDVISVIWIMSTFFIYNLLNCIIQTYIFEKIEK